MIKKIQNLNDIYYHCFSYLKTFYVFLAQKCYQDTRMLLQRKEK